METPWDILQGAEPDLEPLNNQLSFLIIPESLVVDNGVRELTRLGMSGSGDAEAEALQSERLKVSIAGSADVAIGSLEADAGGWLRSRISRLRRMCR